MVFLKKLIRFHLDSCIFLMVFTFITFLSVIFGNIIANREFLLCRPNICAVNEFKVFRLLIIRSIQIIRVPFGSEREVLVIWQI